MRLRGEVTKGLGIGRQFVGKHIYYIILTEILGEEPYLGTLNVRVEVPVEEIERLCTPQHVKTVISNGNILGGFRYWLGNVAKNDDIRADALIIKPDLSKHGSNIIEIISSKYLREYLGLKDGDYIDIELRCL